MSKITGIIANGGEDFVDEISSSITYKYGNQVFGPTVKKLNESDDLVDNALGGALTTLQFGLMNLVIMSVSEYAIQKTGFVAGAIFVFLKTTNVAKRVKGIISGAVGSIPLVGRGFSRVADSVGSFVTKDRELIAKMAMDTSNNMSTVISDERRNQIMIKQSKYQKIDNAISNAVNIRGQSKLKSMDFFTHKFKTGTWQKTPQDKKIYEDNTGQIMGQNGATWNSDFVEKLNQYKEFAVSSEGHIFSNAKATIDLLSVAGAKIIK